MFSVILKIMTTMTLFHSVNGGCTATTTSPLMMCKDNEISGDRIRIDTSLTAGTDNLPGEQCVCTVEITNAKYVKFSAQSEDSICGSRVNFVLNSTQTKYESNENCRLLSDGATVKMDDSFHIGIEKTVAPFRADYCLTVKIEKCAAGQYQCMAGSCIGQQSWCDGIPDCPDEDDEDVNSCDSKSACNEDMVRCGSGECLAPDKWCNGVVDCQDASDENCANKTDVSTTPAVPQEPILRVRCFESTRFTTTTTTTTTTPSTTTTTTTQTTTTTSTTTTSTTTTSPSTTAKKTTLTTPTSKTTSPSPPSTAASAITVQNTSPQQPVTNNTAMSTADHQHNDDITSKTPVAENKNPLEDPAILAAIIIGSILLLSAIVGAIYLAQKKKSSDSKDLNTNDLWIENSGDKQLEPMNPPL